MRSMCLFSFHSNNKSTKNICKHSLSGAKMFKIEKCILNYACFKHPWLVEVMSMLVDINEKIVLSLWSPGRCFLNLRAAIFKNTFFPEHLQWVLPRIAWTLITAEKFNNLFIGKMLTPQNSVCVYCILSLHPWMHHKWFIQVYVRYIADWLEQAWNSNWANKKVTSVRKYLL